MALDPYEQLGVERGATAAEIKAAWRRKVQQLHPDKHPGDPFAATRYELLRESYDILSDPVRRSAYDAEGRTELDNLPERAHALLETVAVGLLKHAQSHGHIGEINVVSSVRAALRGMSGQSEHDRLLAGRAIRGLEKQAKRVRRKSKGQNLLGDLIAVRIEEARKEQEHAVEAIKECAAALALLDEYEDLDPDLVRLARKAFV